VETKSSFDLGYPDGWVPMDPPEGTIAVVVAPYATTGFHSNIVVTLTEFAADSSQPSIDRYLWEAITGLTTALTEPSIEAVWVTEPDDPQPQQRLIVRHLVDGVAVELVQHHTWLTEGIVVISASMAIHPDPDLIEILNLCLLSAATDMAVPFIDWEPTEPDSFASWSPAPDAHRIAHL
jgi:hypothetical protein